MLIRQSRVNTQQQDSQDDWQTNEGTDKAISMSLTNSGDQVGEKDCEKVSIFLEDKVFSFFFETFDAFSFSDFDWYTVPFFGTGLCILWISCLGWFLLLVYVSFVFVWFHVNVSVCFQ